MKKKVVKKKVDKKKTSAKKNLKKVYRKESFSFNSQNLRFISAIFESVLAVPFLGGFFVLLTAWTALLGGIVLGIMGIVYANKEHKSREGFIWQVVANSLGWIPVVGWILHLVAAIVLWKEFDKENY